MRNIDFAILNFIDKHLHNPVFDWIFIQLSFIGDNGLLWIFCGFALMAVKKYRRFGFYLLFALLLEMIIVNITLKPLFEVARPFTFNESIKLLITAPKDFSFPSGHSGLSFAAATVIACADKRLGIAAYVLASLIAFSRLFLYVHYPTDVLAGILIGIFCGFVIVLIGEKLIRVKKAE